MGYNKAKAEKKWKEWKRRYMNLQTTAIPV